MIIAYENDKSIEFKILGYEYPMDENLDNEYDLNWIKIYIKVNTINIHYEAEASYMLTWEAERLILALEAIANEKTKHYKTEFLEHQLSFEFNLHDNTVEVIFCHNPAGLKDIRETYIAEFMIPKREFGEFVRSMRKECSSFPVRKLKK